MPFNDEDTIEIKAFKSVLPGKTCRISDREYVKIDPACEFANTLDKPISYGVHVGTGVITFIGPDTSVMVQIGG